MSSVLFTPDVIENWDVTGKQQVQTMLFEATKDQTQLIQYCVDICDSVMRDNDSLLFPLVIQLFAADDESNKNYIDPYGQQLANVLWSLDIKYQDTEQYPRLQQFVVGVHRHNLVPVTVLQSTLSYKLLAATNIVSDTKQFFRKSVIWRTHNQLTQPSYNAIGESSVGFSLLLTHSFNGTITADLLLDLMGTHGLNPARVIDLLLHVIQCQPRLTDKICSLFEVLPMVQLPPVLALKFKHTPPSRNPHLFKVVSHLISSKRVSVSQLYETLSPTDAECLELRRTQIKLMNQKEISEAARLLAARENQTAAVDAKIAERKQRIATVHAKKRDNQKFALICALVDSNQWAVAAPLLQKLARCEPCSFPPIAKSIAAFIERQIEPLYRANVQPLLKTRGKVDCSGVDQRYLCTEWAHIPERLLPVLRTVSSYVAVHVVAHSKLCRLMTFWLGAEPDVAGPVVSDVLAKLLLPSLTLIPHNVAASAEVYNVLSLFAYQTRFAIYEQWRKTIATKPELRKIHRDISETIKGTLRRLTSENDSSKLIGKVIGNSSHSSPLAVFDVLIQRFQQYPNLISPVVNSLKYLTSLSQDVLLFVLLEALAEQRDAMKGDGRNIADWLNALSTFTGQLFKRYPLNLRPLLDYLTGKLLEQSSTELVLLSQVIAQLTGVEEAGGQMSEVELTAQAGSQLLRDKSRAVPIPSRAKSAGERLASALLDSGLLSPLFILMTQSRKTVLYSGDVETEKLKVLGHAFDTANTAWLQYVSFLHRYIPAKTLNEALPSLSDCVQVYHLSMYEALYCLRPVLLFRYDDIFAQAEGEEKEEEEGVVEMDDKKNLLDEVVQLCDAPSDAWDHITPLFIASFWTLELQNLCCPDESYQNVVSRLRRESETVGADLSEHKRQKEKEKMLSAVKRLLKNQTHQKQNVARILKWFQENRDGLIPEGATTVRTAQLFLQMCVLPRARLTSADSHYCFEYFCLLNAVAVPRWDCAWFLKFCFWEFRFLMSSTTEMEAMLIGRFLERLLKIANLWSSDAQKLADDLGDAIPAHDYAKLHRSNHTKLNNNAGNLLRSSEYMDVRNALAVLTHMVEQFPREPLHAISIQKRIEPLLTGDKEDIQLLAARYNSQLTLKVPALQPKKQREEVAPTKLVAKPAVKKRNNSSNDKKADDKKDRSSRASKRSKPSRSPGRGSMRDSRDSRDSRKKTSSSGLNRSFGGNRRSRGSPPPAKPKLSLRKSNDESSSNKRRNDKGGSHRDSKRRR